MKYICEICGSIYDETLGDPIHGIVPGTSFGVLPQYYACPSCGADKDSFYVEQQTSAPPRENSADFWQDAKYSDDPGDSQR